MLRLRSNTNPLWFLPHRVCRTDAHTWNFPRKQGRSKLQPITQYGACESIVTTSSFWKGGQYLGRWREGKIDRDMKQIYVQGCIVLLSPFADGGSKEEVVSTSFSLLSFITSLLFSRMDGRFFRSIVSKIT